MIPITVVDNFFKDPDAVRNFALSQEFRRPELATWPGKRSKMLVDIDTEFYNNFLAKVLNLFFDISRDNLRCQVHAFFQSIPEKYQEGWTHLDIGTTFTGVVYLTPDAPLDAGTTLSVDTTDDPIVNQEIKAKYYSDIAVDLDEYYKAREENNNRFIKTTEISNVFNRLIIFPGTVHHKENKFFGNTIEDSRLTLVFFVLIPEDNDNTLLPIARSSTSPL